MSEQGRLMATVLSGIEALADAIASRVVDRLRATELPGYVDQSTSPLGRRRHILAVRSGALPGLRIGRRYLARHEDVQCFVAKRHADTALRSDADDVDALAAELGFREQRR